MTAATRSPLHTPLCARLGIRYPICQAGMAFVARADLAAAVSTAGGLGVIAAAHGSPALLREEIRRVRTLTDRPFGVDILFATIRTSGRETEVFTDAVKGWCDVALEERVPVLIAGLGNPGPLTVEAHRLGMTVMALEGTLDFFIQAAFGFPSLGELYKYAAYDGLQQLQRRQAGVPALPSAQREPAQDAAT